MCGSLQVESGVAVLYGSEFGFGFEMVVYLGVLENVPTDLCALRGKNLVQFRTDSPTGTNKGLDGEVVGAAEHGGDPGWLNLHALRQFSAVNPLLFHELEQHFDDHQLLEFGLGLDGGTFGQQVGERVFGFGDFNLHFRG